MVDLYCYIFRCVRGSGSVAVNLDLRKLFIYQVYFVRGLSCAERTDYGVNSAWTGGGGAFVY